MDQYLIEVVEVIEDVRIEVSETIEQVDIQILEINNISVEITEMPEIVNIDIYEVVEKVEIEITEGLGDGGVEYKRWSMPQVNETCYTGFSRDLEALTSEAKWAVKRVELDDTESWAGRDTFDQILDDYLTLTYT
jgi:hypothetical protein